MSKIMFERLSVEESEKVRAGTDNTTPTPDQCAGPESIPPTKECTAL